MRTPLALLLLASLGACASKPATPATAPDSGAAPDPAASTEPSSADPAPIASTDPHPFGVRDLLGMDRISDHQVSPDGKTVVFVRRVTDLEEDRGRTDLWSMPTAGGDPTRLTRDPGSDFNPRFSPDGKTLFFLSSRSGSVQVWSMPTAGGPPTQVTDHPLSIGNLTVSPSGEQLAFSADVFIDCPDLACTAKRLEDEAADPRTGRVYDRMFVRHWDTYKDGRRSHLFVQPVGGGAPVDVTQGVDGDVPTKPFGGAEDFAFSPDSKHLVYTVRLAGKGEPWSTNFDLYAVPTAGGTPRLLTADNPAWDAHPVFSPDGKTLAFASMKRPGYEADKFTVRTMAWPDGSPTALTPHWDRSASSMTFAPDGASLLVIAQNFGQRSLFRVPLDPKGKIQELVHDGSLSGPVPLGDRILLAKHDLSHPTELYTVPSGGGDLTALTHINDTKVAAARMGEPEQFSFKGAKGDTVYGYLVKPVDFDPAKTYPIAFLIHGGPQGSFGNMFHYRWNAQTYAGAGYAVVMIDFHGSTGYGQAFTDAIGDDWGGKPLTDLKKGLAHATSVYPWMQADNACALGASYGGFMINWIASQWPDRFRCLVNHDGVFDARIMYYATEELWFPEWEHRGPYYENPKAHEKHNPALFVDKWKTPMLVVQGALDYRVPEDQGLGTFTALQRRGVESKLLFFPDENHWVLKPNNSLQWHEVVFDWLADHTAK
jgi:dipeptidyl aminopeptidase/acylaminoacyl peptidase